MTLTNEGRDTLHTQFYQSLNKNRVEGVEFDNGTFMYEHINECKGFMKDDTCTCPEYEEQNN